MYKLVIFDCDGVLVDSEMIANRIDAEAFTAIGYPITAEESIKQFVGMSTKSVCEKNFE
ncbi:HAD hydrolase-like protein [Parachlamydia acanthamoebae]|uniref:HAD hydrolase-like protein n=1 Tax=Parachlamydia acanthamoebae TaxID=83552 RepID=UPI00221EBF86|nr:HAD hydrolase-like protein [Parachlamydia acanthamoebae]